MVLGRDPPRSACARGAAASTGAHGWGYTTRGVRWDFGATPSSCWGASAAKQAPVLALVPPPMRMREQPGWGWEPLGGEFGPGPGGFCGQPGVVVAAGHAVAAGGLGGGGRAGKPRERRRFAVVFLMNLALTAGRWRRWQSRCPRAPDSRERAPSQVTSCLKKVWGAAEASAHDWGCFIHFDTPSLHLDCGGVEPSPLSSGALETAGSGGGGGTF